MFHPEELAQLQPEEREAILDAILGMAWSDRNAQVEEIEVLKRIAPHFTDADVETLVREYKPDLERVGRKIARSDLGPVGRQLLMRAMACVAVAAGGVDDAELGFYRQCLGAFGVSEAQREKLERSVLRSLYAELLRKALASGELDEAARAELVRARERFGIPAEEAAAIEKHTRIALAK